MGWYSDVKTKRKTSNQDVTYDVSNKTIDWPNPMPLLLKSLKLTA